MDHVTGRCYLLLLPPHCCLNEQHFKVLRHSLQVLSSLPIVITIQPVTKPCVLHQRPDFPPRHGGNCKWWRDTAMLCSSWIQSGQSEPMVWQREDPQPDPQKLSPVQAGNGRIQQGARKSSSAKGVCSFIQKAVQRTPPWEPGSQDALQELLYCGGSILAPSLRPLSTFQIDVERGGNRPARGFHLHYRDPH